LVLRLSSPVPTRAAGALIPCSSFPSSPSMRATSKIHPPFVDPLTQIVHQVSHLAQFHANSLRLSHSRRSHVRRKSIVPHPAAPWHFLYFLPLPHGHGSLRPTRCTRRCCTCLRPWAEASRFV